MIISYAEIAKRAFEIWEQAGRPDGCDMEHWLKAERELHGRSMAEQKGSNVTSSDPSMGKAAKKKNAITKKDTELSRVQM